MPSAFYSLLIIMLAGGWMTADAVRSIKQNGLTPRRAVAFVILITFIGIPASKVIGAILAGG